jgi:hypothetical protein
MDRNCGITNIKLTKMQLATIYCLKQLPELHSIEGMRRRGRNLVSVIIKTKVVIIWMCNIQSF